MDRTAKERMRRYRNKERNKSVTEKSVTTKGVTNRGMTQLEIPQYPAVVEAVCDPIKRRKLISICQELREHNVLSEVRYGVSGPTFDVVEEITRVT